MKRIIANWATRDNGSDDMDRLAFWKVPPKPEPDKHGNYYAKNVPPEFLIDVIDMPQLRLDYGECRKIKLVLEA